MYAPAFAERVERQPKAVMRPRPDLNRLGPPISLKWLEGLRNINNRLVMQFFPNGIIAGFGRRGFWGVYFMLPKSGYMYKHAVFALVDPATGKRIQPTQKLLYEIRVAWFRAKHEGMEAIYDSIDKNMAKEKDYEDRMEMDQLTEAVEESPILQNATSKQLGFSRVCVPAGYEKPGNILVPS